MAASLTMSMASLAVSGAARAPVARMGAPARAPVKAVGGSAFMPAKLASKMTMKSSLAGAYSLSIRVWRGDDGASLVSRATRRRRGIPTSQIRRSGTRAGATSNPPGAVSGPPSATFSPHPAYSASRSQTPFPRYPLLRRRHAFRDGDSQARRGPWGVGCDRGCRGGCIRGTCRARARTSGFRARLQTASGRKVLKLRRKKGRKYLAPAGAVNGWNREKKKSLK